MLKSTTSLMRGGLVTAGILSVACTESLGPPRGVKDIGAPLFSFSPNGITLDQQNGSLGYSGRLIRKGFDPMNPRLGDAIVATFYWLGSTNIIDSVTDVLTDASFTPVGNRYTLVEYVTAGGISMATYVATNVQNFPGGDSTTYKLAVQANLRESITDGGVKISAWSGVEDVYATALGAHRSASGSGSAPTTVAPGAIAVDAGGVAYAVTMSNMVVGSDPPPDFTSIGGSGSDASIREDGRYRVVASATTVDPQWTWFFDAQHPGIWLASILALRAATGSTSGNLTVTTSTTGSNLDPDGYTITVDDGSAQAIGINGSVSYTNLPSGGHTVAISGVATNCSVSGGTSQSVTVTSGGTATVAYSVSCTTPPSNLSVTTSTSGSSLDPDGYTVTVDGSQSQAIAINSSVTFTNLTPGSHGVVLSGVATNCTVSGGTSRTVNVPSGGTATTTFAVTCTSPNQPPTVNAGPDQTVLTGLLFTLNASFTDPNNDGPFSYRIDWGDGSSTTGSMASPGTISKGHTYITILPRNFTIRVTVTDAHGASGSDTKVVTVVLL